MDTEGIGLKRSILGIVLPVLGAAGCLTLRIFLSLHPCDYNGVAGLRRALLEYDLVAPYVLFCAMGIPGLFICISGAHFRK